MKRFTRPTFGIPAVVVLVLSLGVSEVASGAAPGELEELVPNITRALDHSERVELPPGITLVPFERNAYGVSESTKVSALNTAKDNELAAGKAAVDSPVLSDQTKALLFKCFKDALKSTSGDYVEAESEGTAFPDFFGTFRNHVATCLTAEFTGVPSDVISQIARGLAASATPAANEAINADSTAFANWLSVTGSDTGTTPADGGRSGAGDRDENSGIPAWVIVLVALGAVGALGFWINQRGRGSGA